MIREENIVYMENLIEKEIEKEISQGLKYSGKRTFEELCAMCSVVSVFKTLIYSEWTTEDNKEIVDKYIRAVILNDV